MQRDHSLTGTTAHTIPSTASPQMVKLTGPALGQAASGSLAGALTFSQSKGRHYVKSFKKPKQPNTKPQMAMRAAMTFLSQQWGIFSQPYKDTWNGPAAYAGISPFNAFQRENLTRIRNLLGPTVAYPAAETGAKSGGGPWSVVGAPRELVVNIETSVQNQQWAFGLYNVAGGSIQPVWSDLIGIMPTLGTGPHAFPWTQHTPGTYWITFIPFSTTGKFFPPAIGWKSAIVTG